MDNIQVDEEKVLNTRQTIRQVILPLVQAIYVEEPSDITKFCAQYFEDILQKREYTDKLNDGSSIPCAEAEQERSAEESNEKSGETDISRSNIQGSASLPVLTGDKNSGGVVLRETSSWNEPSIHSRSDELNSTVVHSLIDAKEGIGDQPGPSTKDVEGIELEMRAGDSPLILKNEGNEESMDKNINENKNMIKVKKNFPEDYASYVLPSAPPQDENDKNLNNESPTELEHSKITDQILFAQREEEILVFDGNQYVEISNPLSNNSECFSNLIADVNFEKTEDLKTCQGQLSPNSSFGFIPHLQELQLQQEINKGMSKSPEDLCLKKKTTNDTERFTKQFSETLLNLAEEFDSAESNFNSEFKNVEEISDIIQVQDQAKESLVDIEVIQMPNDRNETDNEKEKKERTEQESNLRKTYVVEGTKEHENIGDDTGKNEEPPEYSTLCNQFFESLKISEVKSNLNEEIYQNDSKCEIHDIVYEANNSCEKCIQYKESAQANSEQDEPDKEVYKPSILKKNEKKDDERSFESRQTVDENWRRRWYEAHPRLDNVNNGFSQRVPVMHRAHRVTFNTYRNQIIHNIGEGGDVPHERFPNVQGERLECSSESNLEVNALAPSLNEESVNTHGSLSADDIYHRMNAGRMPRNFTDRSTMDFSNSNASSQNIPYEWRQMLSNQNAAHAQSMEQVLKDPQLKIEENIADDEKSLEPNSNMTADDATESSSKVGVIKGTIYEDNADSYGSHKMMSDSDNKQNDEKNNEGLKHSRDISRHNEELIQNLTDGSARRLVKCMQACQKSDNVGYDPESFYDAYEAFADIPKDSYSKEFSCKERELTEDDYGKRTDEEFSSGIVEYTKEREIKMTDSNISSLEATENKNSFQCTENSSKMEPGLNSACGDFALSSDTENNGDINSFPSGCVTSENDPVNSSRTLQNHTVGGVQGISAEYFEEIMGRVLEQQKEYMMDEYEGLNFSSFSDSGSSNMGESSDLSETDDPNLNSNMHGI